MTDERVNMHLQEAQDCCCVPASYKQAAQRTLRWLANAAAHLILVEGFFKSLPQGFSHWLVTIRLHVVGGVYVEGAVAPHHQPRGQAAVHSSQVPNDKLVLF